MTALASTKNLPVTCPVCGQTVPRQSRRQVYCSAKCRVRASRSASGVWGTGPDDLNAPAAILRYEPRQKLNDFKGAKFTKTQRSDGIIGPRRVIDAVVVAGREWREVVSSDGVVSYVSQLAKRALV